ncbi:MAG: ankyrin repeat domain-containing protein [Treponema sp.]|jgi:ankyrin repeat protein|nr:ankyrin repeat domain-containing protein [Treponema sp.]
MKKIFTSIFLLSCIVINIFAMSKPDSNSIFNYYIACATGDIKTTKNFLEQYPDCVDIELAFDNFFGDSDKEASSNFAYQRFANYLISKNIVSSFNNKTEEEDFVKKYKRYPIIIASQYGHLEIVKLLISYKANLELKDEYETTPLIRAAQNGYIDIIKELVNNGANYKDHQGAILTLAAFNGKKDVVEYFLKKGVNVDAKDQDGNTALIKASINNQLEIVKYLIKNGADVNIKNNDAITALMVAAYSGHLDVVNLLLKNGADINTKTNADRSALNFAIGNGQIEIVKSLMEYDADLLGDFTAIYKDIVVALIKHHSDIACIILKDDRYRRVFFNASFNPTIRIDDLDMTLLMYAAKEGFLDFTELLINNNVNVNEANSEGVTPLMLASYNCNLEVLNSLIEAGADINARNNDGVSVLEYAAMGARKSGDNRAFHILYSLGATFDIR